MASKDSGQDTGVVTNYLETYNKYQTILSMLSKAKNDLNDIDSNDNTKYNELNRLMDVIKNLSVESGELKTKLDSIGLSNIIEASKHECSNCLKDVYNLHKWVNITNNLGDNIDWTKYLKDKEYTELNTLAGAACHGGNCDLEVKL